MFKKQEKVRISEVYATGFSFPDNRSPAFAVEKLNGRRFIARYQGNWQRNGLNFILNALFSGRK